MTHTPTPWTPGTRRIIGADGHVVCYSSAFGAMDLISDADARMIVLAVNNHERLVGALAMVTDILEDSTCKNEDAKAHALSKANALLFELLAASQPPKTHQHNNEAE